MRALREALKRLLPKRAVFVLGLAWTKLTWPLYRGAGRECLLCGRQARRFRPARRDLPVLRELHVVGGMRRDEAGCPYCACEDRERLVFWFLREKTGAFSQRLRLLHLAPERMLRKILRARPNLDYVGADLDPAPGDLAADVARLPFPDADFDALICDHVLEHVPDDRKAMAELLRVLKPGGWAILQVPVSKVLKETREDPAISSPRERERLFGQDDHARIYASDYAQRLGAAGFSVSARTALELCGPQACSRYGLNEEETLFFCRRP
ncbi:MAG: class I SAM-dependent methyltransferase [Elusimicrobia bacterium]|nr:class I SAM-dependent methyltransferase [Elusimicrobiota bacterium]